MYGGFGIGGGCRCEVGFGEGGEVEWIVVENGMMEYSIGGSLVHVMV